MHKFCKALAVVGLLLGATVVASAQGQTLPPNTVLGRTGISPGPAQAIPFATLSTQLGLPTINLNQLGAKSDFNTDLAPIINAAIASHPNGATLELDPGTGYCINSPILMGDGTNAAPFSTINAIDLRSTGGGAAFTAVINWCNGALGSNAMVKISGMQGWGLHHLWFNGAGNTGTGILCVACSGGNADDVAVNNTLIGISLQSYQHGGETAGNHWGSITIEPPAVANAIALKIDGNGIDNTTNSCCDVWDLLSINWGGGADTATGIYIRDADTISFNNFICNNGGNNVTTLVMDVTGESAGGWPAGITFQLPQLSCGTAHQFGQIGTPTSFAMNSNRVMVDGSNTTVFPQFSLFGYPPVVMPPGVNVSSQTTSLGATNLTAATLNSDGWYRLCGYLAVQTIGAGGATILFNGGWNDGAAKTFTTSSIATNALNQVNHCETIRAEAGTNIQVSTTVAGTMGAANYAFHAMLERLQ